MLNVCVHPACSHLNSWSCLAGKFLLASSMLEWNCEILLIVCLVCSCNHCISSWVVKVPVCWFCIVIRSSMSSLIWHSILVSLCAVLLGAPSKAVMVALLAG